MSTARPVVVQKFGGSSVATVDKLKAVAEKIVRTKRDGFGVVAVVSAMGDTTDELLALARQMSSDPSKRELDMLLSVGERTSMALLSIAIEALGEKAISFTGSQCGIVTNDSHSNARIIDVRPFRVQDELDRDRIVIVAGYQGTSYKREITTLGRGGSDTTAVALAAALGAAHCDIFSDVDGVYTANPRVVADAARLDAISYAEMQELARLGARVLNAQAVEFARRRNIAIHARSTFVDGGGTVITRPDGFPDSHLAQLRADGVSGVTSMSDCLVCSAPDEASLEAVLGACGEDGIVGAWLAGGASTVVISLENVADPVALTARLEAAGATASNAWGTVSAVGLGVGQSARALRRMRSALCDVEVRGAFAVGHSITALVPVDAVDACVRAVHEEFVRGAD